MLNDTHPLEVACDELQYSEYLEKSNKFIIIIICFLRRDIWLKKV